MWSQRVRYGLRAMIGLTIQDGRRISARELAERYDIPLKYLEAILTELRSTELVRSTKGAGGGHQLAMSAARIRLSDIVRSLDPQILTICDNAPESTALNATSTVVAERLATTTLADVVAEWQYTQSTMTWVI